MDVLLIILYKELKLHHDTVFFKFILKTSYIGQAADMHIKPRSTAPLSSSVYLICLFIALVSDIHVHTCTEFCCSSSLTADPAQDYICPSAPCGCKWICQGKIDDHGLCCLPEHPLKSSQFSTHMSLHISSICQIKTFCVQRCRTLKVITFLYYSQNLRLFLLVTLEQHHGSNFRSCKLHCALGQRRQTLLLRHRLSQSKALSGPLKTSLALTSTSVYSPSFISC